MNTEVKRLLLAEIFGQGAEWIQLRADERNGRSMAAIRKRGAVDLGSRQEHLVRRDGSQRRSRVFRIDRRQSMLSTTLGSSQLSTPTVGIGDD